MEEDPEGKHSSLQTFKLRQMVANLRDTTSEIQQRLQGMMLKADQYKDELTAQYERGSKKSESQIFTEESRVQKLQERLKSVTSQRELLKNEIQCLKLQISESDEKISELNAVNNALLLAQECKNDLSHNISIDRKPSTSVKHDILFNNNKISEILGPDCTDDFKWFVISKNSEIVCLECKIKVCEYDIAYKKEELYEALRQIESLTAENISISNNFLGCQEIVNEQSILIKDIMAFLSKFYPNSNEEKSDELQKELDSLRTLHVKQKNEIAMLKKTLGEQRRRKTPGVSGQTPDLLSRCLQHLGMKIEDEDKEMKGA